MAISTYSNLRASVAAWLFRDDLTALITDFITLAESRINRDLRLREFETTASGSGSSFPMPDDAMSITRVAVQTADGRTKVLPYAAPAQQSLYVSGSGDAPQAFAVLANTVTFLPPGSSASWELLYYPSIPELSDSNPTNWLLTRAPDVYLFATLMEAEPYLYNEERLPLWQQKYSEGVTGLMAADERQQFPQAGLQMRGEIAW